MCDLLFQHNNGHNDHEQQWEFFEQGWIDESMFSSSHSRCDDPLDMYLNEPEYVEAEMKALGVECEDDKSLEAWLKWSNFFCLWVCLDAVL